MISIEEIKKAAERLKNIPIYTGPPMFFVGRNEKLRQIAVDFWKDSNIIVVTEDGTKYQRGKKMEG